MAGMAHKEFHKELEERLGHRYMEHPDRAQEAGGPTTLVIPADVEEVQFLAELAGKYGVPLVPEGAATAPELRRPPGAVSVRFDLMRAASVPQPPGYLVEVQPGLPWLHLEDHLRNHGRGLPIYPTSAPRATVGGWMALNGLGVGSFENGRLWENAVSVEIVSVGGGLRTIPGEELPLVMEPGYPEGIIVGATLQTRRADGDRPFGAAFDAPEDLAGAVLGLYRADVPLWHLGLLNPAMAHARSHERKYLLFGAYPEERSPQVEDPLRAQIESHGGRRLPAAEAHRIWGARFFPVSPSQETPTPHGILVPVDRLTPALRRFEFPLGRVSLQGSISRSGEVVLLALGSGLERGFPSTTHTQE